VIFRLAREAGCRTRAIARMRRPAPDTTTAPLADLRASLGRRVLVVRDQAASEVLAAIDRQFAGVRSVPQQLGRADYSVPDRRQQAVNVAPRKCRQYVVGALTICVAWTLRWTGSSSWRLAIFQGRASVPLVDFAALDECAIYARAVAHSSVQSLPGTVFLP